MDLTVAGLDQAIKQYEETFGITPNLLVRSNALYSVGEEIQYARTGNDIMIFTSVDWLPDQAWLVTYGNRGIIYSDGV